MNRYLHTKTLLFDARGLRKLFICIFITGALAYMVLSFYTGIVVAQTSRYRETKNMLESVLSGVEANYIRLSNNITLELAYTLGFKENLDDTVFLSRDGRVTAFSGGNPAP